eukprot:scaffold172001_cov32-Tisochrysis_lutea.AAC.1
MGFIRCVTDARAGKLIVSDVYRVAIINPGQWLPYYCSAERFQELPATIRAFTLYSATIGTSFQYSVAGSLFSPIGDDRLQDILVKSNIDSF